MYINIITKYRDIILQIQNELELINNIIETHSQKYFYILENDYYVQLENIINYKKFWMKDLNFIKINNNIKYFKIVIIFL